MFVLFLFGLYKAASGILAKAATGPKTMPGVVELEYFSVCLSVRTAAAARDATRKTRKNDALLRKLAVGAIQAIRPREARQASPASFATSFAVIYHRGYYSSITRPTATILLHSAALRSGAANFIFLLCNKF